MNALWNRSVGVLFFLGGLKGFYIGGFNADEDAAKSDFLHKIHELFVVSQIHGRFAAEFKGPIVLDQPFFHFWEQFLDRTFVTDEIIIHQINVPPITQIIKSLKFRQDLIRCFDSWNPSEKLNNIAKFAFEWTAACELDSDVEIRIELQQFKSRNRRTRHFRFSIASRVDVFGLVLHEGT